MSHQTHNPKLHAHGDYERSDIATKSVVYFLIGLAVACLLAYVIVRGLFSYLDHRFETEQKPISPLVAHAPADTRRIPPQYGGDYEKFLKEGFPAPQLEVNERTELNDERMREENTLSTYDWVDQKAGTVRIPIDRAMELLAQRGMPVRSQTSVGSSAQPPAKAEPQRIKDKK
jgi:hypothetical protein